MKRALPYLIPLVLALALLATPRGPALDHWMSERAIALTRESPALRFSMQLGAALGRSSTILAGLLVPAAFGGDVARVTVRIAAVGLGAAWVATTALKAITNRTRPNGDRHRVYSSFPSGHASISAALALTLARRNRRLAWPAWTLVAWIGASRVFLAAHYPSDVLAGVAVGALSGALALRLQVLLGSEAAMRGAPGSQPLRS